MPRKSKNAMLRRSRAMVTSPRLWKPRMVFWIGALATGVVSAGFAFLADQAQHLFAAVTHDGWRRFLPLAITPLGFVLCAWLALRYFPGSQGSGIPQAIAARHLRDADERSRFLSMKMVAGKILLTILGLLSGASIGREGPTVQVGASIMLQAARIGGMAQARGLILAGSAAGIAAAFNTPLAGIVFAIEEMGRSYQARTNGIVLSAVILAGLASLALVGNYTYFGAMPTIENMAARDWLLVVICGVVGGAFGAGFSAAALRITRAIRRWSGLDLQKRTIAVAGTAGLLVAAIGVASGGMTFGTGYSEARTVVEGGPLPAWFFLGKMVASLASTVSGIPGGLFAPSLSVGAGLGSTIGSALGANISLAAVVGMAGYFAGVVQAPMTAFVIVMEMTGNHANIIPLMVASMLGYGVSRVVSPEPLYHALSRLLIADALRRRRSHPSPDTDGKDAGPTTAAH